MRRISRKRLNKLIEFTTLLWTLSIKMILIEKNVKFYCFISIKAIIVLLIGILSKMLYIVYFSLSVIKKRNNQIL
jgi:hypothetical protein